MKKPSPEQKDVLNPEEAVWYFGFSRRKFFRMLREGKFKKYTALYGRRRLILRREFEKYLEENLEVKGGAVKWREKQSHDVTQSTASCAGENPSAQTGNTSSSTM